VAGNTLQKRTLREQLKERVAAGNEISVVPDEPRKAKRVRS